MLRSTQWERKLNTYYFNAFTFEEAFNKFEEHFVPKWNILDERACFHWRAQKDGENVEAFIQNLYELAEHCEVDLQRDEQIQDRIVIGILDKSLLQKLQMKSDLNHDTAIEMACQQSKWKFKSQAK